MGISPRRVLPAPLLALALLLLVGCSNATPTPAVPPGGSSSDPTTAEQELIDRVQQEEARFAPNDRGNIVRQVGERVEVYDANPNQDPTADVQPVLFFTIHSITAGAACPSKFDQVIDGPVNGQFLALAMTVETTPEFTDTLYAVDPSAGWELVTAQGESLQVLGYEAATCSEYPFSMLQPARRYEGTIFLDVPADVTGAVIVLNAYGEGGWEFAL